MEDNNNLVYRQIIGNDYFDSMWIEDGTRIGDDETIFFIQKQIFGTNMFIRNLGSFDELRERSNFSTLILDRENFEIGHIYDREITKCLFILRDNTIQNMGTVLPPSGYIRVVGICSNFYNGLFADERPVDNNETIFLKQPNNLMIKLGTLDELIHRSTGGQDIIDNRGKSYGSLVEPPNTENLFVKRPVLPEIPNNHILGTINPTLNENGTYDPLSLKTICAKTIKKGINEELSQGVSDERLQEIKRIQNIAEEGNIEKDIGKDIRNNYGGKAKSRKSKKSKKSKKRKSRKVRRLIPLSN